MYYWKKLCYCKWCRPGGHVKIGDYAILGGNSSIHQFVSIGKHTMISGGSLVRKDVPPYVKRQAREPLSYIGVNSIGLRRRGFLKKKLPKFKIFTGFYFKKTTITLKQLQNLKLS